ncbi:hypothetical protein Tco_0717018 [Tanacetum coccineum]
MKMKGAMNKRNNAMAGVGDGNRIAVTNHEIRSEQEQDQVNLNRDVAVWVAKNNRTEVWAVGPQEANGLVYGPVVDGRNQTGPIDLNCWAAMEQ